MLTSALKSSVVGARRGPQKGPISYGGQDQDDDELAVAHNRAPDDDEPEEEMQLPARRDKDKRRATLSDVPEERESETKKGKFAKEAEERPPKHTRPLGKSKKETRPYRDGVRKSAREHYKPLEWWRGEKRIFGRSQRAGGEHVFVPPIREIIRIPKEEPEPLTLGKRKRSATRARSKSKGAEDVQAKVVAVKNPEEGWDDGTKPCGVVVEYDTEENVERRIAWTANMQQLREVSDDKDNWLYQKVFGDADFVTGGVVVIPVGARKPTKRSKNNVYVFWVIEGAVKLQIHETTLVLATGATFIVPRGNTYLIENISERDVKLFYTEAREAPKESVTSAGSSSLMRSSSVAFAQADRRAVSKVPTPKRAAFTRRERRSV